MFIKKVFQNRPGVYGAGIKGITVANDSLPVARLLLGTYEHDSQLVDLSIMLEKKTGADWQTERQIRHERGLKGVGWRGHCPDGILIFTGGNRIAIELELSPKGTAKIEKILKEYAKKQYEEIWYFVNSGYLAAKIQSAALPFIKVFSWPGMKEYEDMTGSSSARPLLGLTGMEEELKTVREFFHR